MTSEVPALEFAPQERHDQPGPITDDPEDWALLPLEEAGDTQTWQSLRNANLFSQDHGKTFYDVTEPWPDAGGPIIHNSKETTSA